MFRDWLCELGYEDSIIFDSPSFDEAIIGVSTDGRVIYDYQKMIVHLAHSEEMTYEEAADFIDYNTIRSLPYQENTPIVVHRLVVDSDAP